MKIKAPYMFEKKNTVVNTVKILGWNPGDNSIF